MEKTKRITAVQYGQMWSDETLLLLALRYLREIARTRDFETYLERTAQEENAS